MKTKEVVNKAYKFRVYPTRRQEVFFAKHFGCTRFIYNYLLSVRRDAYQKEGKSISGLEAKKLIPGLKRQEEYEWLKEVNSQSLQEAALDLNSAYERFFKKINGSGYPKFKKKGQRDSFSVPQSFQIDPTHSSILIPKLKTAIRAKFHQSMKKVVEFNSISFSKSPSGKYYASINVDEVVVHKIPVKKVTRKTKTVGIDLGLKDFLVESNGKKTDSPKYLRQSERKLKKSQQRLSRKQKGSNNRNKQRLIVAKLHDKISNQRKNFLHEESSRLVNENQVIYLETLNVKGMMKNRYLSKSIADSGWGEFLRQLKYKSHWRGSVVVQVGMWEATSKLCFSCGYKNKDLKLSDREWTCPECGCHHDRDINAAKNTEQIGREAPELTPVKRTASVFSIRKIQAGSRKQESLAS